MTRSDAKHRDTRESVLLTASIASGDAAMRCRVMNLSRQGVCVAQAGELERGAKVRVTIGRVEDVLAEIVWTRGDLAGLTQTARAMRPAISNPSDMNALIRNRLSP